MRGGIPRFLGFLLAASTLPAAPPVVEGGPEPKPEPPRKPIQVDMGFVEPLREDLGRFRRHPGRARGHHPCQLQRRRGRSRRAFVRAKRRARIARRGW